MRRYSMYHQEGPPDLAQNLLDRPRGFGSIWIIIEEGDGPGNPDRPLSLFTASECPLRCSGTEPQPGFIRSSFGRFRESHEPRKRPSLNFDRQLFRLGGKIPESLDARHRLDLVVADHAGDHITLFDPFFGG